MFIRKRAVLLFVILLLFFTDVSRAASCCGGGASNSLLLPKFGQSLIQSSFSYEKYDGFWNQRREYTEDPRDSDLKQYRANAGYGLRLGKNWQSYFTIPYVVNDNKYTGEENYNEGLGDSNIRFWYEFFDNITCVWDVNSIEDLEPATYFGMSLVIPTGISQYDDVESNFEITGLGFYRLDTNFSLEKTIYPFTASYNYTYGRYFERPVNREYGEAVEPYRRNLGDRTVSALSIGYTIFTESFHTYTMNISHNLIQQQAGTINGQKDLSTQMKKRSIAYSLAYAPVHLMWNLRVTYSQGIREDEWGQNFPVTDFYSVSGTYVYF